MTKAIVHEVYIVWQIMWMLEKTDDGYIGKDTSKELWDIYMDPELAHEECVRAKKDDEEGGLMFSRYEVTTHTVKDKLGDD